MTFIRYFGMLSCSRKTDYMVNEREGGGIVMGHKSEITNAGVRRLRVNYEKIGVW